MCLYSVETSVTSLDSKLHLHQSAGRSITWEPNKITFIAPQIFPTHKTSAGQTVRAQQRFSHPEK